jgi:hypothetical protein
LSGANKITLNLWEIALVAEMVCPEGRWSRRNQAAKITLRKELPARSVAMTAGFGDDPNDA